MVVHSTKIKSFGPYILVSILIHFLLQYSGHQSINAFTPSSIPFSYGNRSNSFFQAGRSELHLFWTLVRILAKEKGELTKTRGQIYLCISTPYYGHFISSSYHFPSPPTSNALFWFVSSQMVNICFSLCWDQCSKS